MVDALSSGGSECMLVGVQLPPLAPATKGLESEGSSPFALSGQAPFFRGGALGLEAYGPTFVAENVPVPASIV